MFFCTVRSTPLNCHPFFLFSVFCLKSSLLQGKRKDCLMWVSVSWYKQLGYWCCCLIYRIDSHAMLVNVQAKKILKVFLKARLTFSPSCRQCPLCFKRIYQIGSWINLRWPGSPSSWSPVEQRVSITCCLLVTWKSGRGFRPIFLKIMRWWRRKQYCIWQTS